MGVVVEIGQLKGIRQKHKNIALCSGCYDLMHSGHAVFFEQCKELADILVVSVGRDEVIRKLKGEQRPVNPELNRLYLVAAMKGVDYAVLGGTEIRDSKIDFYCVMSELRPDIFVLNDDDSAINEKRALCGELGIELKLVPRTVPDYLTPISSTEIYEKIRKLPE